MQDRFKFRVWKKYNCSSYEGHKPEMFYNAEKTYDCTTNKIPEDCFNDILEDEGEYVVMQCTGLKDKNGKLIYEGDVVNVFFDTIKPHYMPFVVIWDRKEWQLAQLNKNYKKCENCNRNYTKCKYCKKFFMATGHTNFKDFYNGFVIGNIYENPELLESEE